MFLGKVIGVLDGPGLLLAPLELHARALVDQIIHVRDLTAFLLEIDLLARKVPAQSWFHLLGNVFGEYL